MSKRERKGKNPPTKSLKTDIPLKLLLKKSSALFPFLFNDIPKELPFSLPTDYQAVFERKPDFLGLLGDKTILHIELETLYHPDDLPKRMLLYNYLIFDHFSNLAKQNKIPRDFSLLQKILYVGEKTSVPEKFLYHTTNVRGEFSVISLNQIPAEKLFEQGNDADKLLSVLTKLPENREEEFLKKLFQYIGQFPKKKRVDKLRIVLSLLGYRKKLFEKFIELERREEMPIEIPREMIKENPLYQMGVQEGLEKGLQEGRKKGLQEGRKKGLQEGRREGKLKLLKKALKEKFPNLYKKSSFKDIELLSTKSIDKIFLLTLKSDDPEEIISAIQKEIKKS